MKIAIQIPAFIIGLLFVASGIMFFLHMPMPPMEGDAGTFATILYKSGYLTFVKVLEVLFGLALLVKPTRALGQILIAPIIVNIFLFEVFLAHKPGIGVALIILNALAIYLSKEKYLGIIAK